MSATEPEAVLETQQGDGADPGVTPAGRRQDRPLGRGDVVGRYVVLERVGVGGMGEVYAAYDPELDRKIAIKLLLPGRGDPMNSSGHGRLLREAQAMAKLHHPNVVAVHDVGTHGARVFLAMEFVEGGTLADAMDDAEGRDKPDPWPSVLARFLAAGEGLAAAHAAGLIHRDFKPANVLVGRDGSVRVADFGLARRAVLEPSAIEAAAIQPADLPGMPGMPGVPDTPWDDDATLPALGAALPPSLGGRSALTIKSLSMRMTRTGATLGTPAYMAPEQYGQTEIDARADQFSFCVALWEALYGQRPFVGDNLHVLMLAIAQAKITEPPASSDVPAPIRRALIRGLDHDPERRWPDMNALMTELRFDPRERRRKLGLAALGVTLLGALAWGVIAADPAPVEDPPCTGAAAALGDALSFERRDAIAARFSELDHDWARDVGDRLLPRLDAWTREWQAGWTDACEATHVRNEQSAELLDRRMLCLNRQRRGFVAIVDGLITADDALARKADGLLDELGSLAACSDSEVLLRITPMPDDPEAVKAIVAADETLSEVHGLYLGGRMKQAQALLETQRESVTRLDYTPLSATFEQLRGRLGMTLDDPAGGEQALERAFGLALQAGDDHRAARVARSLSLELKDQDRATEALRWLEIGAALVERLDDDGLRGEVAIARTQILAEAGDYSGSEAAARSAYELFTRARPDSAVVGDALYLLGVAAYRAGRYDETIARLEQARQAWVLDIGPRHPRTVAALGLLGGTARVRGDYASAESYFREALAIEVETYGEDNIQATTHMINLSVATSDQGKFDEAIALSERVLAIHRAQADPNEVQIGRILVNLAQMQGQAGLLDQAHANLSEGEIAIREALGQDHPDLITLAHIAAMIELDRGELAQAERNILESLRIAAIKLQPDNPALFEVHTAAARIALARGQAREAQARLVGPPATADTDPKLLGERELVQAEIHAALGREAEALAAAQRAKRALERAGPGSAPTLAAVEAWLRDAGQRQPE